MAQQQMQIQKAYKSIEPTIKKSVVKENKTVAEVIKESDCDCNDLFAEIKVDALDRLYVQARTIMDSWVIWVLILIGVLTVLPFFLGKFGVKIQSPFKRGG